MDLRQVLATNLRRLRHASGLSQEALAHEAGVNRSYMSKVEKGATYGDLEIIGKLATALEVEPAELLRLPPRRRGRGK
jgi:transcriptional regulator with XRE-family HTH domain